MNEDIYYHGKRSVTRDRIYLYYPDGTEYDDAYYELKDKKISSRGL